MKQVTMYLGTLGIGRLKLGEILSLTFFLIKRLNELSVGVDIDKIIKVLADINTIYKYNALDEKEFVEKILLVSGVKNVKLSDIFDTEEEFYLGDDEELIFNDENKFLNENIPLSLTSVSCDFLMQLPVLWKSIVYDFKRKYNTFCNAEVFTSVQILSKGTVMSMYSEFKPLVKKVGMLKIDLINWLMYQELCTKEGVDVTLYSDSIIINMNILL